MTTIENLKTLGAIATVVGLWVIISPFLWSVPSSFLWTMVATGVVVTALSAYTAYVAHNERRVSRTVAYLAGFGGLFVIISPYAFQVSEPNLLLNNFVAGGIIAVLTGYSGYVGPALSAPEARRPAA